MSQKHLSLKFFQSSHTLGRVVLLYYLLSLNSEIRFSAFSPYESNFYIKDLYIER